MPKAAKHRDISRQLRAQIASGHFRPGGRLPSESQMVKQYGVSRITVARALLDLQMEGLVERRAGSGSYVKGGAAVQSAATTRQFGLLIPGLDTTEIFQLICGELASLARVVEYSLLWGGSTHPRQDHHASLEHAQELCEQFIERRVNGVFFAPFELVSDREKANRRIAEVLRQAGIPVILLDRDFCAFPNRSDFDLVGLDNFSGGFLVGEHLIKLGCRKLRFVARPGSAPTVDARIAGVREAMLRNHVEMDPGWIQQGDPADLKFVRSLTAGKQADAVVCANDDTASRLMRSLESVGAKVPRDIRIVGFDDAKYASLVSPSLTTVHQPCRDMARIAFRAMVERIEEPTLPARSFLLPPRLVVRESCGAYLRSVRS